MMYAVKVERSLLFWAGIFLLNGLLVVGLAAGLPDGRVLASGILLIVSWFVIHAILRSSRQDGDPLFLPLFAFLSSFGLVMILRLKPDLYNAQCLWFGIGMAVFLASVFLFRRLERLSDYTYLYGAVGVGLLLSASLFGVDIGGNKNWIILGPIRFEPSEFAKLFIVLFLASYLDARRDLLRYATKRYGWLELPHPRFLAPLLVVWGLTMMMLVFQRDLGAALLFFSTTMVMVYIACGRLSYLTIGFGLFLLGSVAGYFLYPHVHVRIDIWLNPWADPNGRAYQVVQSLFAIGSGGVLGSGLTFGYPLMIPEVHTDFVFAAVGEEMGLSGMAVLMMTYLLLVYRGFRAALTAPASFLSLTAAGLSVFFALQVFVIVAGVTKFLPLTGITLPFLSYGGSSIVSNSVLVALLFVISETRPDHA